MAEENLSIKISADAAQARRGVREVADDIDELAGKLGGQLGAKAQEAAAKLRELGQQEAAVKSFLSLQTAAGETERRLKALTQEADRYAAQIAQAGPPTAQEAANLARLRAAADTTGTTLAHQKMLLAESAAAMQRHGIATEGASRSLQRIQTDIQKTAQGF